MNRAAPVSLLAMRIQDTKIWNDPLVEETIAAVAELGEFGDTGDLNDHPVIRMLMDTDCLDPLTVAMVVGSGCFPRQSYPQEVNEGLELARADRVREEGPQHLFEAGNVSALRLVLAEFAVEATGDHFKDQVAKHDKASLKPHIDAAAANMVALADGLVDYGLWREIPPKLLDKFIEAMDNVRGLADTSVLKRGMCSSIANLKTAVAEGTMQEITEIRAPCIDPSSRYEAMKHIARTRYRL